MVSAKRKFRARSSGYDRQMGKGDQRQMEAFVSSSASSIHTLHAALHPCHKNQFRGEQKASPIYAGNLFPHMKSCMG